MKISEYVTLGRSGLRVSPLCLGTLTFGTEWGYGMEENAARAVFNRYLDAGGNFIDTASNYVAGASEKMLGKFISEQSVRNKMVLATKFTSPGEANNPNAAGNGRKNMYRSLEISLKRLRTDYVDLFWMHTWDGVTPAEEVLATFDTLIREGKVRYAGLSNVPAWYAARMQTIAEREGKERIAAMQLEYSLVERHIEREHIPAAQELGLAVCAWGPIASGFLAGKYRRDAQNAEPAGRLDVLKNGTDNPGFDKFSERNWRILEVLVEVANAAGCAPATLALNWTATQPGITSTLVAVTKVEQLEANFEALDFTIATELRARLDEASALDNFIMPYGFFRPAFTRRINGGVVVKKWNPASG